MWMCEYNRIALFAVHFKFFFSSRRRHTRWPRDWSSDVCSSDLCRCPGRSRTWCPRCSTRSGPRRAEMARAPLFAFTGGVLALLVAGTLSLLVGARSVGPETVWQALVHFDQSVTDHVVIHARLERTVAGIAVGASLAAAGAAMQGLTRNPLADPGILGLNAGAAAAVVVGIYVLSKIGRASCRERVGG